MANTTHDAIKPILSNNPKSFIYLINFFMCVFKEAGMSNEGDK